MSERRERGSDVHRKSAERLLSGEPPTAADGPAVVALDRLLSAAAGDVAVDPERAREREALVLAAFRAARDAGGPAATRPQDDWRPRGWRRVLLRLGGGRSRTPKVVAGSLAAAIALGGVAVAAGNGELPVPFGSGSGEAAPSQAPGGAGRPSDEPSGAEQANPVQPSQSGEKGTADRPGPSPGNGKEHAAKGAGRAEKALCRAYGAAKDGHGEKHLNAASFKRLVEAAGGERAVDDYCAALWRKGKHAGGSAGGHDGSEDLGASLSPSAPGSASADASGTSNGSAASNGSDSSDSSDATNGPGKGQQDH